MRESGVSWRDGCAFCVLCICFFFFEFCESESECVCCVLCYACASVCAGGMKGRWKVGGRGER